MADERPREDDEESDDESAAPSGGGGRFGFLRRLASVPALLKREPRPAMFGGAIVMLVAWTWMLWQLVAATTALNASVETLAGEVQTWAAAPAPASSGAPPSILGHSPAEVVREDADAGGESPGQAEPPASASDAVAEGSAEDQAEDEPPLVTLLGKPVLTGGADIWNCVNFESWEQADRVYRANLPHDANILDFDGNGVPCEALPGAP